MLNLREALLIWLRSSHPASFGTDDSGEKPRIPCWRLLRSERDHLVRHVAGKRLVEVREAADRHAGEQLVRDLALVAALVAAHQQHAGLLRDLVQAGADRVAVDQDIVVVLEEEHADDVDAVPLLLELRQDHLGENVRDVMALGGEDVGDFHRMVLPVGIRRPPEARHERRRWRARRGRA